MTTSQIEAKMQKIFADRKDVASRILTAKTVLDGNKRIEAVAQDEVQVYEAKLKDIKNGKPVSITSFKIVKNSLLDKKVKLTTAQISTAAGKQKLNQLEKVGQDLEAEYRKLEEALGKSGNNILE